MQHPIGLFFFIAIIVFFVLMYFSPIRYSKYSKTCYFIICLFVSMAISMTVIAPIAIEEEKYERARAMEKYNKSNNSSINNTQNNSSFTEDTISTGSENSYAEIPLEEIPFEYGTKVGGPDHYLLLPRSFYKVSDNVYYSDLYKYTLELHYYPHYSKEYIEEALGVSNINSHYIEDGNVHDTSNPDLFKDIYFGKLTKIFTYNPNEQPNGNILWFNFDEYTVDREKDGMLYDLNKPNVNSIDRIKSDIDYYLNDMGGGYWEKQVRRPDGNVYYWDIQFYDWGKSVGIYYYEAGIEKYKQYERNGYYPP